MVLSSQVTRPAVSHRYMASRRRRGRLWPWFVVAAVGVALLAGLYHWTAVGVASSSQEAQAQTDPRADSRPAPRTGPGPRLRQVDRAAAPSDTKRGQDGEQVIGIAAHGAADRPPATLPNVGSDPIQLPTSAAGPLSVPARDLPEQFSRGMDLLASGKLVEGRQVLSELLFSDDLRLAPADGQTIRDALTSVNRKLVFSPTVVRADPVAEYRQLQPGDVLARIAPVYKVPFQFIGKINQVDPNRVMAGQRLKLVKGPFHARIVKRDFRMDVYLRGPHGRPLYVISYPVGLGETDSTPEGMWVVERGKKVINPDWRDPVPGGRYYPPDDPKNPIGEFWVSLRGTDEQTKDLKGYGLHGTIALETIGQQSSMGCVRLRPRDIEQIFHMLVGDESMVEIVP